MRREAIPDRIKRAIRKVITRVLPVPAPASTSSGPWSVVTASSWGGFSDEDDWDTGIRVSILEMGVGQRGSAGIATSRSVGESFRGLVTVKRDCLRLVEWSSLQTVDLSVSLTLDHQSLNL